VKPPTLAFSAIVVTYYTGNTLNSCLDALLNAPLCHEIILVNNGNPPGVVADLTALTRGHTKLTLIDGHGNIGFGRGCNHGADQAAASHFVFVNPDCVIDAATLASFSEAFAHNPTALLGGALRNSDGSEQRGCRRGELTLWSAIVSFAGLGRHGKDAGIWRDFNRNRETAPSGNVDIPTVSGALMAISKDSFDLLEGFDAAYFLHVEDIDLCKRARDLGLPVIYVPAATALHIGATSATTSFALAWAKIASFSHYFWTHATGLGERLAVLAIMPFLALAIMGRALVPPKG
jgi:N-acetylglucosaminyl-diphospho-decaprenol L-rhamnosyltransferase